MKSLLIYVCFLFVLLCHGNLFSADQAIDYRSLSQQSGGLAVIVDHDHGASALQLAASKRFLVHLLQEDAASVSAVRAQAVQQGVIEFFTNEAWAGPELPYNKNHINLLAIADFSHWRRKGLHPADLVRVLSPFGVACLGGLDSAERKTIEAELNKAGIETFRDDAQEGWLIFEKPRPATMGEWPQYTHGADGNRVANDTYITPPNQIQWLGSDVSDPRIVSKNGLHFNNTGSRVIVKNAWSGVILWTMPVSHQKGGRGVMAIEGNLLVLDPKSRSANGKAMLFDGQTGAFIRSFGAMSYGKVPMYENGLLFLSGNQMYEVETGKLLWDFRKLPEYKLLKDDHFRFFKGRGQQNGQRMVMSNGRLYFRSNKGELVVLEARTGKVLLRKDFKEDFGSDWTIQIAVDDHVLLHSEKAEKPLDLNTLPEEYIAKLKQMKRWEKLKKKQKGKQYGTASWHLINPSSGTIEWTYSFNDAPMPWVGSVFRTQDRIWFNRMENSYLDPFRPGSPLNLVSAEPRNPVWDGVDIKTGKVMKTFRAPSMIVYHCGMINASEKYLTGNRPHYFTNLETGKPDGRFGFGRPGCDVKSTHFVAQGLFFAGGGIGGCSCVRTASFGKGAFSGDGKTWDGTAVDEPVHLVEQGTAQWEPGPAAGPADWPMLRADAARSNNSAVQLPKQLKLLWSCDVGTRTGVEDAPLAVDFYKRIGGLTQATIADGRAYVAVAARKQVVAVSVASGEIEWSYNLPAIAASSPTYYKGLAIVACHDGWVYGLRADSGALVWRTRAAPTNRALVAYGQIESKWPVVSTVILKDTIYAVAGRSTEVDGGVYIVAIDPKTGAVLRTFRRHLNNPGDVGAVDHKRYATEGTGSADVLHADGETIIIARHQRGMNSETGKSTIYGPRKTFSGIIDSIAAVDGDDVFSAPVQRYMNKETWLMKHSKGSKKPVWKSAFNIGPKTKVSPAFALVKAGDQIVTCMRPYAMRAPGEKKAEGEKEIPSLMLLEAKTGERQFAIELPSFPITDGISVAQGRIFIATEDGKLLCYGQ